MPVGGGPEAGSSGLERGKREGRRARGSPSAGHVPFVQTFESPLPVARGLCCVGNSLLKDSYVLRRKYSRVEDWRESHSCSPSQTRTAWFAEASLGWGHWSPDFIKPAYRSIVMWAKRWVQATGPSREVLECHTATLSVVPCWHSPPLLSEMYHTPVLLGEETRLSRTHTYTHARALAQTHTHSPPALAPPWEILDFARISPVMVSWVRATDAQQKIMPSCVLPRARLSEYGCGFIQPIRAGVQGMGIPVHRILPI